MSLQVDGVWKGGVGGAFVWGEGVWREGEPSSIWADKPDVTTIYADKTPVDTIWTDKT